MKTSAKHIELFKNLSQFDLGNVYYDFHNDFDCIKVAFENDCLLFLFKKITEGDLILLKLENIDLVSFEFENFSEFKNLTIDNLYRGRFEMAGQLIELNDKEKSYFYVDFVEAIKIELWCENVIVESLDNVL